MNGRRIIGLVFYGEIVNAVRYVNNILCFFLFFPAEVREEVKQNRFPRKILKHLIGLM